MNHHHPHEKCVRIFVVVCHHLTHLLSLHDFFSFVGQLVDAFELVELADSRRFPFAPWEIVWPSPLRQFFFLLNTQNLIFHTLDQQKLFNFFFFTLSTLFYFIFLGFLTFLLYDRNVSFWKRITNWQTIFLKSSETTTTAQLFSS